MAAASHRVRDAELKRSRIQERVVAGLAKAQGKRLGRSEPHVSGEVRAPVRGLSIRQAAKLWPSALQRPTGALSEIPLDFLSVNLQNTA